MCNEQIELEITPTGLIRTIYKDDRVPFINSLGGHWRVKRASNVEWEEIGHTSGWTVRAVHNPELAIRWVKSCLLNLHVSVEGPIRFFETREDALISEEHFFFDLLPKETT